MKHIVQGLLLLVCMAVTGLPSNAQEVIYSPYEKFDLRQGDFSIIGKVGDRLFTYRTDDDGFYLDAWDDSMVRQATVVLDFFPQRIYETRFIAYSSQIIVLYQGLDGTKLTQYVALLDERGRLIKGPITLSSTRTGVFGANKDYYSSVVSDNKKWILVYGFEDKRNELTGSTIWLNDSLRVTERGTASFHASSNLNYGEGILTNEGTLYVPAYTNVGSGNYSDQAWMLALPRGERRFAASELPLQNNHVSGLYIKQDNNGNRMYLCGFYSDRRAGNAIGVVYSRFDLATNAWEDARFLPIDETIRNSSGERSARRAMNDYVIRQVIIRKDGGFALLAEDYYVSMRNNTPGWGGYYSFYNGPFMTQTIREYHYEDVMAISYNEEGKQDWYSFIHKSQYSQEDGGVFSSYALLNTGGALGLLFNDFNQDRSRIGLATVDGAGKVDMRFLSTKGNDEPDWLPRSAKQIASREIVVPCMRRRQLCFAKIVF